MEEAAQTLRAGRWRVFADVSLPLMRPGLANAFLISFIESIADFGNPILLGGNFGVLSTEIFFSVVGAQLDQGRAATLGILLLLFALAAFFAPACACSARKVYTSLAGKGDAGTADATAGRRPPSLLRRRAAVGAPHRRDLRDGAHRRLRRNLGPRLHAHAAALREGLRRSNGRRTASCGRGPRGTRSGPRSGCRRSPRRPPRPSASWPRTCSRGRSSSAGTRSNSARCSRSRFPER